MGGYSSRTPPTAPRPPTRSTTSTAPAASSYRTIPTRPAVTTRPSYPIRDARTGSTAVTLDDDADIWYRNEHTQTLTGTVGMSSYDGPTGLTAVIASGVEDWSGFDLHDCEVHASTDGSGTGYPVVRYTHLEYGTLHLAGDLTRHLLQQHPALAADEGRDPLRRPPPRLHRRATAAAQTRPSR